MNRTLSRLTIFLLLFFCLLPLQSGYADEDTYIPPSLKEWVTWVQEKDTTRDCAWSPSGAACSWPSKLALTIDREGAIFQYTISLDRKQQIPLPGNQSIWPQNVRLSAPVSQVLTVESLHGLPGTTLEKGTYTISGSFSWPRMPDSFPLPPGQALLDVSVQGKKLTEFTFHSENDLWLESSQQVKKTAQDSVQLTIYRKLVDEVPFQVITQLELRVSGRARELALGHILFSDSVPVTIQSSIPYQYTAADGLLLQIKPGIHTVTIDSRMAEPPATLNLPSVNHPDVPKEEVWSWVRNERYRSVELTGAPQIDPGQTSLPDDWKRYPAYLMNASQALNFEERHRGEDDPGNNSLSLNRTAWLDQDGTGYTIRDTLSGTMKKDWRLSMKQPIILGQVLINGQNQLITSLDDNTRGVEIRNESISLTADSRLEDARNSLPAVGWDQDMNSASLKLHLPPGWELLHAEGVDSTSNTWISKWSLLSVFGVTLITVAVFRLFGFIESVIALITLVLIHARPGAPFQLWFHLLICVGLLRVMPDGGFRTCVRIYGGFLSLGLLIIVLTFMIHESVIALFPQLGSMRWARQIFMYKDIMRELSGFFAFIVFCTAALGLLITLIRRKWQWFFGIIGLGVASFVSIVIFGISTLTFGGAAPEGQFAASPSSYNQYEEENLQVANSIASFDDMSLEVGGSGARRKGYGYAPMKKSYAKKQKLLQRNDPSAIVQTGPGVPDWTWRSWDLSWSGPVSTQEKISLWLLSPVINSGLGILRCLLIVVFSAFFFREVFPRRKISRSTNLAFIPVLFMMLGILAYTPEARADYPSSDILKELEQRLNENRCTKDCTIASSVELTVGDNDFTLVAKLHSKGKGSWGIPGPLSVLRPENILLDGSSKVLLKSDKGRSAWIQVADGVHTLTMNGVISQGNAVTIQLPSALKHLQVNAPLWEVDGISSSGGASGSIQLIRRTKLTASNTDAPVQSTLLPRWYHVHREIELGTEWTITTSVTRIGDSSQAESKRFPLLKGEAVTSDQKVSSGTILVPFVRGNNTASWQSTMEPVSSISLEATSLPHITETWTLRCSSIFHCNAEGLDPFYSINAGQHIVHWKPWPTEHVDISVVRPKGSPGQAITIDTVTLTHQPGARLLNTTLSMKVRSSRGDRFSIKLPKDSRILTTSINNAEQRLQFEDDMLYIPIAPGEQNIVIQWRNDKDLQLINAFESISLPHPAANAINKISMPQNRWVLWAHGPAWGPVFLYWGQLLFIAIVSFFLGSRKMGGLSISHWMLLGLGLSVMPVPVMIIPPLWLLLIQYRSTMEAKHYLAHDCAQLFLVGLTAVTLLVFWAIVWMGLTGAPDMNIIGYGSSNWELVWYTDRITGAIPSVTLYSVPLGVWRIVMFLWSLWAVFSLLHWLRNAWEAFQVGGMWQWREKARKINQEAASSESSSVSDSDSTKD